MSGSMFIAVRTNNGELLYANGHSRSAYDVFSYVEIFDGDDTKARQFIAESNGNNKAPTHLRPLEYGVVIVDFITKQILHDSYYDTNIDLMRDMCRGSFITEMEQLDRVRVATQDDLAFPIYDKTGKLWDGAGDFPDEGYDTDHDHYDSDYKYDHKSLKRGYFFDYSPWRVGCYPQSPGGRVAFFSAAEECGITIDRTLWEGPRVDEECADNFRTAKKFYLDELEFRKKNGIKGSQLYSIDEDGRFSAHVILEVEHAGRYQPLLFPVTLPGGPDIVRLAHVTKALFGDETVYATETQFYDDVHNPRQGSPRFSLFDAVVPEDRLAIFATMMLGSRRAHVDSMGGAHPLYCISPYFRNDMRTGEYPVVGILEAGSRLRTLDDSGIPIEVLLPIQKAVQESMSRRWACYEGDIVSRGHEPYWSVLAPAKPTQPIEVMTKGYGGSSHHIYATFGAHEREKAMAFAKLLVEIGCGTKVSVKGEITLFAPEKVKHRGHASELCHAFDNMQLFGEFGCWGYRRDKNIDLSEVSGIFPKQPTGRPADLSEAESWDRKADWEAGWAVVSKRLDEMTDTIVGQVEKSSWARTEGYGQKYRQFKRVLDFLTFGR